MDYQRILVFGAHPDDELTMAGTIARLAGAGVEVTVVTLTNGSEGYPRAEMRESIVACRRQEAAEADRVLGVARRHLLDRDDMALAADKPTVKDCVRVLRQARPHAVFAHGPHDRHRDHLAAHTLAVQATWHAGEPVAAELGPPWRTPHLYYYKGCRLALPTVVFDTTGYAHKFAEARATQVSQHTLFGRSKEELLAEAEELRRRRPPASETFWLVETNALPDFLPLPRD
ncbi:MAG: PIG-L deacetylase family protein [Candidatus Brocadiia bacterium]